MTAAVVRHSGGVVALCDQFGDGRVHVLTSADGRSWSEAEAHGLTPTAGLDVVLVNSIVEGSDSKLVAVGAEALEDISSGDAATWSSEDGLTWSRAPASDALRDAEMLDVVATGTGFIAVGDDGFPGANVQLPGLRGAASWSSSDGVHWQRAPALDGGSARETRGIVATRSGWAAWGEEASGGGAVWTMPATTGGSAQWSLARPPGGGDWGPIGHLVESEGGTLVGVGAWRTIANTGSELETFGIWGSYDDGVSWGVVSAPEGAPLGLLWDVTASNGLLVATGAGGMVITSRDDGMSWSWIPADPSWAARLDRVLPFHGELLAFSTTQTDNETINDIWIGVP